MISIINERSKRKIKSVDWLLILAFILAPMTGLRVWKVGPAEALCVLWSISQFKHILTLRIKDSFIAFWFPFLFAALIGSCIGEWFYPAESNINGMLVWLYLASVSLATYSGLKRKSHDQLATMLIMVCYGTVIWYFGLYIYSLLVSRYFVGARLWYGYRFTGGAANPHQIALLFSVVVLYLLFTLLEQMNNPKKWILVLYAGLTFFLLYKTYSTTALAATVCGIVILCVTMVFKTTRARIVFALVILLLIVVNGDKLYELFMAWVASDANGMGRFNLIAQFPTTFWKSPVFGLGPGTHAGGMEYHNTYLEVFATGGLVGFIFFLRYSVALFKNTYFTPGALAILSALYVYGLAGFGMRRLVYWIMISFIYCIADKTNTYETRKI